MSTTSPLIQNVLNATLPTIDYAEGIWLYDTTGKDYIDGCSGAVVTALGHADARIASAMQEQAAKVTFTHRGAFTNAPLEELARRLTALTGYAGAWFVGSGSEAAEAAMQFALQYFQEIGQPQRVEFLSARRGYHGNTLGALSASGHARRRAVAGIALDIPALPTPYAYRDQGDRTEAQYTADLLAEAGEVIRAHGDRLAAVMIEPVGGATLGATEAPAGYLSGLKTLCEHAGALLIADEVMTGMGRTGTILASMHDGVEPDLVAMGKGLGAGYTPIAATLVSSRILDTIQAGSGRVLGGHTYAGNPLSAAVALAVLDAFVADDLLERSRTAGLELRRALDAIAAQHPLIGDVRGRGMMLGVEFVLNAADGTAPLPQGRLAAMVTAAAMNEGLIIYPTTGGWVDAAQIAPPLTISETEIAELARRFDRALTSVERELHAQVMPEEASA